MCQVSPEMPIPRRDCYCGKEGVFPSKLNILDATWKIFGQTIVILSSSQLYARERIKGIFLCLCKPANAYSTNNLKRLVEQSVNDPDSSKTQMKGKNKVGRGASDEEFLAPKGEENLSVNSDDDESSRSQAKKAKVMGPGKKRGTSTTQVLRKSQRNQEEGGSSNGVTSTLPGQPLADHGQVMSVVAANDQSVKKKKGPITRHYSSKDAIKW